jgi:tricorn protease
VPAAGGAARPLLQTRRANELEPDWSPDGRRLAFQSSRSGSIQIWVLDLRSKVARRLTKGRAAFSPDWSPDGRRIAFQRGGQVVSMRAGGGDLRYVTRASWGTNGEPDW